MFRIMPAIYDAEMQKARAEANFAEIEYLNTKRLMDSNIVSPNELALAKAKFDKAKAELSLAQIHLGFTEIKAPFDGIMGRFQVRLGSLIEEGDLLSHIERNHQHYLFCLHTIIQSWVAVGRPLAKAVSGIRFKEWERVIGGILNMRPEAPLNMFPGGEAGRRRMMDRMSSPDFERIAALCADLIQRGVSGQWLTCRQMAELTDDKVTDNSDEQGRIAQQIGIMLADFCPVVGQLKDVGEHYKIQRQKRNIPEKNYKATNEYCILESSQMSDSVTSLNPGTAA